MQSDISWGWTNDYLILPSIRNCCFCFGNPTFYEQYIIVPQKGKKYQLLLVNFLNWPFVLGHRKKERRSNNLGQREYNVVTFLHDSSSSWFGYKVLGVDLHIFSTVWIFPHLKNEGICYNKFIENSSILNFQIWWSTYAFEFWVSEHYPDWFGMTLWFEGFGMFDISAIAIYLPL